MVDYIEGNSYKDIDLDGDPCMFLHCGHFLTVSNMDGQMGMAKYYEYSPDDGRTIVGIKRTSEPFSSEEHELKTCPSCRGSLRDIPRYGRIVKRALLDESTKRFVSTANIVYRPLAERLLTEEGQLLDSEMSPDVLRSTLESGNVALEGSRNDQIATIKRLTRKTLHSYIRYGRIFRLRSAILVYLDKVRVEEQPFRRVWDLVQSAHRRNSNMRGDFKMGSNVSQPLFYLWGMALLLRCDLAIISDFSRLKSQDVVAGGLFLNLQTNRGDCISLIDAAVVSKDPSREAEGHLLYARYAALEMSNSRFEGRDAIREDGLRHVVAVEEVCKRHPDQTQGIMDDVEQVHRSLNDGTFYIPVTSEERRAVIMAMTKEFQVTGHWYNCENGHPFTIGVWPPYGDSEMPDLWCSNWRT